MLKSKSIWMVLAVMTMSMGFLWSTGSQDSEEVKPGINYPKGDVTIIVPGKTGGNVDILMRIIAKYLTDEIGHQVVVENKPGANSLLALSEYVNEKPNSERLQVFYNAPFTLHKFIEVDQKFSIDQFEPIIGGIKAERILYVNSEATGINNIEEYLEYSKNNDVIYASGEKNNIFDLLNNAILKANDINQAQMIVDGNALATLLGGHVTSTVHAPNKGLSFVKEGRIKPILTFSDKPYTGFEGYEVPTAKEYGLDVNVAGYNFVGISKGSNQEVIDYWVEKFQNVYADSDFQAEMAEINFIIAGGDPSTVQGALQDVINSYEILFSLAGN
jgi:putative tricarboxylic transport membrane protein